MSQIRADVVHKNVVRAPGVSGRHLRNRARSLVCPMTSQTSFLHSFRQAQQPYSLASIATMDEHQPRFQLLTIAGRRPTKACTSALAWHLATVSKSHCNSPESTY